MGASDVSLAPAREVIFPETIFRANTAGDVPLGVQGATGQTARLLDITNAAGTSLGRVEASGTVFLDSTGQGTVNAGNALVVGSTYGGARFSNAMFSLSTGSSANVGAVLRGMAGQTANLTEWQSDTGVVLGAVNSTGVFFFGSQGTAGTLISPSSGRLQVIQQAPGAVNPVIQLRGAASQSGNLLQWEDSAGTVLGGVNPAGVVFVKSSGTQTNANLTVRGTNPITAANSIEWGHSNQAGYGSTIGYQNNSGAPFIAFGAEAATTLANGYRTRGLRPMILALDPVSGTIHTNFRFASLDNTNADNQAPYNAVTISTAGAMVINGAGSNPAVDTERLVVISSASQTQSPFEVRNSASSMKFRVGAPGVECGISWGLAGGIRPIGGGLQITANNNWTHGGGFIQMDQTNFVGANATTENPTVVVHIGAQQNTNLWSTTAHNGWMRWSGNAVRHGEMTWHPHENYFRLRSTSGANFDSWANVLAANFFAQSTEASKSNIQTLQVNGSPMEVRGRGGSIAKPTKSLKGRFSELRAVSFKPVNDDDAQTNFSFVAEEAYEAVPEIVAVDGEGKPTGISLLALTTINSALIQEQQKEIEELRSMIQELRGGK